MAKEHDDAVEKVLAAFNKAAPPPGMEARIAQRLEHHSAVKAPSRWRKVLIGWSLSGTWWRGAVTGALFATGAACALFLFESPRMRPSLPEPIPVAQNAMRPPVVPISTAPTTPCGAPPLLRAHAARPDTSVTIARGAAPEHSRPIVQRGLTPEERALVHLTHIADPGQLATLNRETQARLQAEDDAAFEKFFTPPPRPKIDEGQPQSAPPPEAIPAQKPDQSKAADQTPAATSTQTTTDLKGQK